MTSPIPEAAAPIILTTIGLGVLFGHDATFWVVVASAVVLKLVTSDPVIDKNGEPVQGLARLRQWFILFLGGIIPPFALTKVLAEFFDAQGTAMEYGIAFGLVIVGEGLFRWLHRASHNPERFFEWAWKMFKGGGK